MKPTFAVLLVLLVAGCGKKTAPEHQWRTEGVPARAITNYPEHVRGEVTKVAAGVLVVRDISHHNDSYSLYYRVHGYTDWRKAVTGDLFYAYAFVDRGAYAIKGDKPPIANAYWTFGPELQPPLPGIIKQTATRSRL